MDRTIITGTLERDRLDVRGKSRSNLFNWRGQFTPEFIEYLLEKSPPRVGVLDPFCGSGTVIIECARRGIPAVGCEINPAAYAMSKFFTFCNTGLKARNHVVESLYEHLSKVMPGFRDLPLLGNGQEFRARHGNLYEFATSLFGAIKDKQVMLLALLLVFHTEDSVGNQLGSGVTKSFETLKHDLLSLPLTPSGVEAHLHDARLSDQVSSSKVDLIITSPPYINVFNYHQNYRAVLEILGFDMLRVAQSEVGSNRKNRGNRFRTVIQYCLDMEQALASFARTLSSKGRVIMVVGRESRVRGVPFYNSSIIKELFDSMGCFEVIGSHERAFTNRFGMEIKEDIIICNRLEGEPSVGNARQTAVSHLEQALAFAESKVKHDISDALCQCASIEPSPLFKVREVV
jgi:DNA modification methylase